MRSKLQSGINSQGLSPVEERAVLTVTCLAAFLFFNSFGSIAIALPLIQKQFGNSLSEIQWIVLLGVVTIASLSFCFGRAGTIIGQRRLYKAGVALYAVGAGLGGISTSFIQLLGARAVMAIGLAMALPMSTAILAASFDPQRRGRVLGLFASAIAVGRMTGPAIGGLLLQLGGWTAIFWMNCILGLIVTAAVTKIFRGPGERRIEKFDLWGALTLSIGYPSLLLALTFGVKPGWAWTVGWMALSIMALAGFVWIELSTAKPLVDLRMFRNRTLALAMSAVVLSHLIYNPITLSAPLYLQNVLGATGVTSGFLLAALPLSTAMASPLGGRLADRFEGSMVAGVGLILIVGGIALYSLLSADTSIIMVAAVLGLLGAGIGLFTPANQKLAFAAVAESDYGVLGAMLSSFGTAAGTIGTTLAVALMEAQGGRELWASPTAFARAQQYAFMWLAAIGVVALWVAFRFKPGER